MQKNIQKIKNYWPLLLIILLGLVLRWPDPEGRALYLYSELLRDLGVERAMHNGQIVLLGPSSHLGGFNFGPVYYYILFPFAFLFKFAPYSLATASVFFSLGSIVLSFFIVKKWHSPQLGFIVSGIISICEFDISFARYASNPNFLPFFAFVFFYSFQQLMENRNIYRNTIFLGISFAIATQLHAVALISLPIIMAIAILRKDIFFSVKQWVIFIFSNIVIYAPYLYYESIHNFSDLTGLLLIASTHTPYGGFGQRVIEYFGFWFGPWLIVHLDFDVIYIVGNNIFYVLAGILLVGYLIFKFNSSRLKPLPIMVARVSPTVRKTMLYWLIVPSIILLMPFGAVTSLLIFYFFILTPLIYFFYGWIFFILFQKGWNIVGWYLAIVFICLQIFQYYLYNQQLNLMIIK